MSKEYGYIGKEVTQAFRDNKGIFTPQDIIELDQENKWTNFGQLELIESQTVSSSVSSVEFTSMKENIYNVHFLTYTDVHNADGNDEIRLSFLKSGVSSGPNQRANLRMRANGTFNERRSTSTGYMEIASNTDTANGYVYFYNFGDSTKISTASSHSSSITGSASGNAQQSVFGISVRTSADVINGIKIIADSTNIIQGSFSLYGIRSF